MERKNRQRLRRLMIAYGRSSRYTGGVYYQTPITRGIVKSCAADANNRLRHSGLGVQIATRPLDS